MSESEIKPSGIYLGDSYELIKKIPSKSIDLIYTDIPYLYNQGGGGNSELAKRTAKKRIELMGVEDEEVNSLVEEVGNRTKAIRLAREKSKTQATKSNMENGINYSILDEFVRVSKHIYIYIWCSKAQILPIMKYFVEEHNCIFDLLTWHKTNPTPTINNCYPPDTEYCLMFREKGTKLSGNMETLKKYYVSPTNKYDKDNYLHPCCKPMLFVENHILNSTKEGDVVLDPFVGSGTTCLAAKHLKRKYIGIEINEQYYKIAVDRLKGINQKGELNLFDIDYE